VSLIATLVLLLGLGGALFGIHVANVNAAAAARSSATPAPTSEAPTPTPTPTATPTPTPTPTVTPTAGPTVFALPDLTTVDFTTARQRLRDLRLGWRLVFEGTTDDPGVRATDPAAGTPVHRGITVKVFVRGAAPPATVPAVVGLTCPAAADAIVNAGLYPQYASSSRDGLVVAQTPAATDPADLHWNDMVHIQCGGGAH
jgi:hypothetical protein